MTSPDDIVGPIVERARTAMGHGWTVLDYPTDTPTKNTGHIEVTGADALQSFSQRDVVTEMRFVMFVARAELRLNTKVLNQLLGTQDGDASTACSLMAAVGWGPLLDAHDRQIATVTPTRSLRMAPEDVNDASFLAAACDFMVRF